MKQYSYPTLQVMILAAGKGTRMRSTKPKVLHGVLGKSLLEHVLLSIEGLNPRGIGLIVGHGWEQVRDVIGKIHPVSWIQQKQQLGTGHAVQQGEDECKGAEDVLIVCGDTPLLQTETLVSLLEQHRQKHADVSFLSAELKHPTGYGRVIRDTQGAVACIVEERDANDTERAVTEVSSGIFCVKKTVLFQLLKEVNNDNEQGEYYLPDIVPLALKQGLEVHAFIMDDATEMQGVNDRAQLRNVTEIMQQRVIHMWEKEGVSIEQPHTVRIDVSAKLGTDCYVRAGTQILGNTHIGDGCELGPYAIIKNAWLDDNINIGAFSHIDTAHIGEAAQVGPYARLRPQAELDEGVKIGNFVEVKKSVIGKNSKVNHLSYIGDTTMGENCNIGAGTITCNYDGANKHQTRIDDEVFVGSDTKLIAPVHVEKGATIGAGSVITKTVHKNGLTLSVRPEQRYVKDWKRPKKS